MCYWGTRGNRRRSGAGNGVCTGTYANHHRPLAGAQAQLFGGTYIYHCMIHMYWGTRGRCQHAGAGDEQSTNTHCNQNRPLFVFKRRGASPGAPAAATEYAPKHIPTLIDRQLVHPHSICCRTYSQHTLIRGVIRWQGATTCTAANSNRELVHRHGVVLSCCT